MASDKMRAAVSFAKLLLALAVGYGIYFVWMDNQAYGFDEIMFGVPYIAIGAGLVSAIMVLVLLSRLNKGSGD